MAYIQKLEVTATTDSSGDVTAYSEPVTGFIEQIRYSKTDYANGVDFVVTVEGTGEAVWSQSNVNASTTVAPRQAIHGVTGTSATYDGTYPVLGKIAVSSDRIKIVVDEGGDTKSGTFYVLIS